ncbi:hepatocyte growth factor activator-like isoform X3 [Penaeus monodon]|uniref:hepatocyte growth factor activator-like isoform X3 n=2 Tax=Penaeus monodon TaxID=6687 RepID=UPI0018A72184|nr:hepatocyte growth factor activator-like isoform X3 [Penaeus monodon]
MMRAGGLACALLLLASGASNALPQYGGAGLQQQQQEGQGAVVGGTSGTAEGFTPTQSSDCALGHGCVPWQYCLNGEYKFNPSVNLDVRSPAKVPEHVSQKLCGQIGNVCCPIPEDILLQQQLAQAGVGGGVVAGVPGAGVHAEQTSVGGGGAGGYGGSGGIISGTVSGGGVVSGGLEQSSSGGHGQASSGGHGQASSGGHGQTSGGLSSQCRVGFDCVPSYQCDGGVINTSGVGLINIRTKVQKCANPEYPTVEAVCCKIPGASEPTILACPAPEECVPYGQCKEDGTINTDGTGLIDVRINTPCHLDSVNYEKGVCCLPPRPEPLATCPNGLVCELEGQCATPGALAADGAYTSCYTGSGATGICCEPPQPLDACPGDFLCKAVALCSSPATIDGSYAECYIQGGSGSIGVCCEPPAPLLTCPGELECKLQEHCDAPGALNVDGSYTTCYVGGGTDVGICCEPPVPLQTCPGGQQCKLQGQCNSPGALNADGSYTTCYVGGAVSDVGICCEPPPPVDVCPGGRSCVDQCSDPAAANADGSYTLCNKPDGSGVGACCELAKIVDVCPADSVCLPEVLCQGEFLNQDEVFVSYATGVTWSKCPLSGNLNTPGICCRTPKPVTYPTADTCGVRNYALDTRIKSPLAKNEAVFGEFPWQAIIFFTNYTYKCGASLVDERHLITGAHCVAGLRPDQIQVRLGEWQVNTYDEPLKYVDASVAEIALHPDFKGGSLHNDIALITLAAPVEFQFHINSVCVPDEQQVFGDTHCFATGWGKDAFNGSYQVILKQVDLPLVDNYACQEKLRKTRLGKYFILDKSFVCAGGEEGKDACTGDGGGPLVCKDATSGLYFLKGITAWGISCGEKDVPGVYADVQYLRPWLNSVWGQTAQQVSGYGK